MQVIRFLFVFLALMALASSVFARQVDVTWQMQGGETLEEGKQRALEKGWAEAVLQESLQLMPGSLAPERQEALRAFLAPLAERFILESSETRLSESVDGMHLGLEVSVDTAPLRQLLQRVGVFYTAGAMLPYSLVLKDAPEGAQETVRQLELLSGLRQEEGAMPQLQLSHDGKTWQGAIQTGKGGYDVAGSDLQTLWLSLWGWYFMVHGAGSSTSELEEGSLLRGELVVEGWPAPDGVYDFEEVLKGLQPSLARATLKTLALRSGGVVGVWDVVVRDPAALRSRLESYMHGRGLAWRLEGLPEVETPRGPSAAPAEASLQAPAEAKASQAGQEAQTTPSASSFAPSAHPASSPSPTSPPNSPPTSAPSQSAPTQPEQTQEAPVQNVPEQKLPEQNEQQIPPLQGKNPPQGNLSWQSSTPLPGAEAFRSGGQSRQQSPLEQGVH